MNRFDPRRPSAPARMPRPIRRASRCIAAMAIAGGLLAPPPAAADPVGDVKQKCPDEWSEFIDSLRAPSIPEGKWAVTIDGTAAGKAFTYREKGVLVEELESPAGHVAYMTLIGRSGSDIWGVWTATDKPGCRLMESIEESGLVRRLQGPPDAASWPEGLAAAGDPPAATTVAYTRLGVSAGQPKTAGGKSEKGEGCTDDKDCVSTLACCGPPKGDQDTCIPKTCSNDRTKQCVKKEDCKTGKCNFNCAP